MRLVHASDLLHSFGEEVDEVMSGVSVVGEGPDFLGLEQGHVWVLLLKRVLSAQTLPYELLDAELAILAARL